jgi:hypothetical protein
MRRWSFSGFRQLMGPCQPPLRFPAVKQWLIVAYEAEKALSESVHCPDAFGGFYSTKT